MYIFEDDRDAWSSRGGFPQESVERHGLPRSGLLEHDVGKLPRVRDLFSLRPVNLSAAKKRRKTVRQTGTTDMREDGGRGGPPRS